MATHPEWSAVRSPEEDHKLLFRFAWREMQIEIVTRRRLNGDWQRIKEILPLYEHIPAGLAGSIQALIARHAPVPFSASGGTAIV